MNQIKAIEEMAGKTVKEVKMVDYGEDLAIIFDDESFVLFAGVPNYVEGAYVKLSEYDIDDKDILEAVGMMSKEERERIERQEWLESQAREENRERELFQRLAKKYGGSDGN